MSTLLESVKQDLSYIYRCMDNSRAVCLRFCTTLQIFYLVMISSKPASVELWSQLDPPWETLCRSAMQMVRDTKSVCVLLIDVLDASGSFLTRVRDLIGSNPVIVIATKCDLLPKGSNLDKVKAWVEDLVGFKSLNALGVYLVSSKTGEGFDRCTGAILSQRLGRDVYVVGAANVGKTAFVRATLKEMRRMESRHFDSIALLTSKRMPVESTMPGTTLGLVKLGAFSSGGYLYDTPGESQ